MISNKVELSPAFKKQTVTAIASIALFVIVYLILVVAAIGLAALCVYGAYGLIVSAPGFVTIALGIGIASLGLLVLFFLLKFVFKSNKTDLSHLIEIKETDEPELFAEIRDIVNQVGTTFPKKVFLSHEVNASVFYNSTFWSMFFPIKKNLLIGMGLVNSVNRDELRAILSHEFGHFSQQTMKVGSYVYNLNQVIFNMLYDNESFDSFIEGWAKISGYFFIFVILAVKIINGIQWILQKLYEFINKSYMGLSREMEFHADEIAANVTGYPPLRDSLLRINLSSFALNAVFGYYDKLIDDNITSPNIFEEQTYVMQLIAQKDKIQTEHGLPKVTLADLDKFNTTKLEIKDQWASHPSDADRIERLEATQLVNDSYNYAPATTYFQNVKATQEKLTEIVFKDAPYKSKPSKCTFADFQTGYAASYEKNTFSDIYNGYYDNHNPEKIDVAYDSAANPSTSIDEIFSDDKVHVCNQLNGIRQDLGALEQIRDGLLRIKFFDYDGKKYKKQNAFDLIQQLRKEEKELQAQLIENDKAIYKHFIQLEQQLGMDSLYQNKYDAFIDADKTTDEKTNRYNFLMQNLQFVSHTTSYDQIARNFAALRSKEKEVKSDIKLMLEDVNLQEEMNNAMRENFTKYVAKDYNYFAGEMYMQKNLEMLFTALNDYAFLLSRNYFIKKKELLHYQAQMLKKVESN